MENKVVYNYLKTYAKKYDCDFFSNPPINGERVEYVLLHQNQGVCLVEVIDSKNLTKIIKDIPLKLQNLKNHKKNISELYLARSMKSINEKQIFKYLLCFPNVNTYDLSEVTEYINKLKYSYVSVAGEDTIYFNRSPIKLNQDHRKKNSLDVLLDKDELDDLHNWCTEYEYLKEQGETLELSETQSEIISRDLKREKILGPAGSGKSVVLVGKARKAVEKNQRVLFLVYNKTLPAYIRSLCTRKPFSFNPNLIKTNHFHAWLGELDDKYGEGDIYSPTGRCNEKEKKNDHFFDIEVVDKTKDLLLRNKVTKYDLILVDELNDMHHHWMSVFTMMLKAEGKLIVAGDDTQNIYSRSIQDMSKTLDDLGFKERQSSQELRESYRLPDDMIKFLQEFLNVFPVDNSSYPVVPAQTSLLPSDSHTNKKWVDLRSLDNSDNVSNAEVCADEIVNLLKEDKKNSVSDLTFISSNKKMLSNVVKILENKKYKVQDTLKDVSKRSFKKESEAIKCTTIQSYKGFEGRLIVIYLKGNIDNNDHELLKLLYVALSRVKKNEMGSYITLITDISYRSKTSLEKLNKLKYSFNK